MKKLILLAGLLLVVLLVMVKLEMEITGNSVTGNSVTGNSVTGNTGNSVADSDELFFECKFVSGSNGTRANITFNKVSNTATVVTDLMMGPMLTHRADPALTADSLVVSFYPYLQADSKSNLIVNRDTLKMTGIRNGTCKIVEKKNRKF